VESSSVSKRINTVVLVHGGFVDGSGWRGVEALAGQISEPAWKTKPSWYLLVTDDRMIPIAAQRFMCERAGSKPVEVPGNHAIYVSNPRAVAGIIQAAASAELAAR